MERPTADEEKRELVESGLTSTIFDEILAALHTRTDAIKKRAGSHWGWSG